MKTSAEKSSTATSVVHTQASNQNFFAKNSGGEHFFAPAPHTPAPAIQMKMSVNQPGDKFEQEADKTATRVMRLPTPAAPEKEKKLQRQAEEKLQKAAAPEEKLQQQAEEKLQKSPANEEKLQRQTDDRLQKAALPEEKLQKQGEEKLQKASATEEKLQRRSTEGAPAVDAGVQSAIRTGLTGGQPLSSDVRSYMEPRFQADFSNVRVHADPEAAKLSNRLSARAFTYQSHIFFSRDQYQPGTSEGKHLLAHELTHTIQQGHSVQRQPQVSTAVTQPHIQRSAVGEILDWFADKANYIPGFRMFTIVLGVNPINMRSVDRSAANILRALIEFMPGASFVTSALDNHGVFTKIAGWIETQIKALGMVGQMFKNALMDFIDSLGVSDLAPWNWDDLWDRGKRIFTAPIDRLIAFAMSVVTDIIKFIKDAILKPLVALAKGTRGYDLLCALLGEDPITGEPVPRTADTLIGGFMKLIGQEEIWENLKKGNAVARAWAWFQGALAGLLGFARSIPRRIIDILTSLTIQDIVTVAGAFTKIVGAFINIAGEFYSWAFGQVISLLEILFSVVAPAVVPYLKKAQAAFQSILKNPIGFVGNLVRAAKLGFQMFAGNILLHLKTALIKWIVGPLAEAGVYIPKSFSLIEIAKMVLSVLGLTWQAIRAKLVKIIPEPVLVGLEKTAGILVTLVKDGPIAAWEQIKTELSELKDQLIAQISQMISIEVVKAAVVKLVSMLNPAGAVIQAIIAIYNTITFFIEKIKQIAAVVASFINSIAAIAAGQIAAAAKRVEQTMASTLTVVLAFLAKFAGLGGIPAKLTGIIKKIRAPIDKALDKIVTWLGNMLKKLVSKVAQAGLPQDPKERLRLGMQAAVGALNRFAGKKVGQIILDPILAGIKIRYGFSVLEPFPRGNKWWVRGTINPTDEKEGAGEPAGQIEGPETADAEADLIDDGKTPLEERKALISRFKALIGNPTLIDALFSAVRTGQKTKVDLKNLINRALIRNLSDGFRLNKAIISSFKIYIHYEGFFVSSAGNLSYGRKVARDGSEKGLPVGIADIKLKSTGEDIEGVLSYDILVSSKIEQAGIRGVGSGIIQMAMDHFQGKFPVTAIAGDWLRLAFYPRAGMSDNLSRFIAAKKLGKSDVEAAKATWTYSRAKSYGYDQVRVLSILEGVNPPETISEVHVEFRKSGT